MLKLLVFLNFSTLNLQSVTVDLEDVKDLRDSCGVDCGADEPKVESLSIVARKDFTFINLQ